MKRFFGLFIVAVVLFCCTVAHAQAPCPGNQATFNGKLACMLPDIYGRSPNEGALSGVGDFGNKGHIGHFDNGLAGSLSLINGDISQQLSLLPLASPGSGFSLTFDPALKTFVTSTDSLGPILSERADTVGKHRLAFGISYQFFEFDKIDGQPLSDLPLISRHNSEPSGQGIKGVTCSATVPNRTNNITPEQSLATYDYTSGNPPPSPQPIGAQLGDCSFVRDRFETQNSIKLHVHQVTAYATFGLTRNLDVSVVVPFVDVLFGVTSRAIIQTSTYYADHVFAKGNDGNPCPANSDAANNVIPQMTPFTPAQVVDCFQHNFPDSSLAPNSSPSASSAKGIGDVTVRLKDRVWRGERLGIAAGVDVRFPTGDALNYLGSGAYGVKPFVIASYHARVAPHGMVGFEANGTSVTSGDLTTGAKGQIPNEFVYDAGVDAYATKRLTAAFDIIGQRVFNNTAYVLNNDTYLAPCYTLDYTVKVEYYNSNDTNTAHAGCDVFRQGNGTTQPYTYFNFDNSTYKPTTITRPNLDSKVGVSTNITNASMGVKVALVNRLVLSLNVLIRLDDGGLHSKPAPMAALGYTF